MSPYVRSAAIIGVALMALSLTQAVTSSSAATLGAPTNLRVEGLLSEAAIISETIPRFSFTVPDLPFGAFGVVQTSYHITVSMRDPSGKPAATSWDSGNVDSAQTTEISYAGSPLSPMTRYQWTVEISATGGLKSDIATGNFETGPMIAAHWQNASWLTGSQHRRDFSVPTTATVSWARAYVASPGCATVEVNGHSPAVDFKGICPWVVDSEDQDLNTRYMTHDISAAVVPGNNAIGIVAGNVMAPQSRVIAIVKIQLQDGSSILFSTNSSGWMQRTIPYVTTATAWETDIDWTLWEPGWSSPGGATSFWNPDVGFPGEFPKRALQMPFSAVLNEVKPVRVQALADGDFLYTFPKNFVGTIRIKALPKATAGTTLRILSGEWLSLSAPPPPVPPTPLHPVQCGEVGENDKLELGGCAKGEVISAVEFASFGTPKGNCTSGFVVDPTCNAKKSQAIVSAACLGKASCIIRANNDMFEGDPCNGVVKRFAGQIKCGKSEVLRSNTVVSTKDTFPLPPLPPPGNGTFPTISGSKQQFEIHVLRANDDRDLETIFCWHGFQYVRVTPGDSGFAGALDSIVGLEIHTNMTSTGKLQFGGDGVPNSMFERAAAILQGIFSMTLQSQRTNVAAYMPTDCPTREKHGWLGDALDASEQALYNFDTLAVHTAFLQTIEDNQGQNGDVPVVVPAGTPKSPSCNDIAWTSAYPQIANMLRKYYGDLRLVERHWPSLVLYQENLINVAHGSPAGIAECDQFKDWLCGNAQSCCSNTPANSSCPVGAEMGSFNYVLGLKAMSEMANALGNSTAGARYNALATSAAADFHKTFYNPQFNQYGGDLGAFQSLNIPALKIHSPPTTDIFSQVLGFLQSDIEDTTQYTPRVGAVTSKVLLDVLSDNGLHDTAMQTATSTTEPSWGYWWSQNSTTCWEAWPDHHGTRNHIFLCGGVGEWMWKYLVGLMPTTTEFAEVSIAPQVSLHGPATLAGEYLSPRGVIASTWSIAVKDEVTLNVSLPMGVQHATIVVPTPFHGSPSPAPPSVPQCRSASESDGASLSLGCRLSGSHISSLDFVSFGTPSISGDCSSWTANTSCNANNSKSVVEKLCLGKSSCDIEFPHSASPFGDPCPMVVKTLAVRYTCSGGTVPPPQAQSAIVYEGNVKVWDGHSMVGTHPGLINASASSNGVAFSVTNGMFHFKSTVMMT